MTKRNRSSIVVALTVFATVSVALGWALVAYLLWKSDFGAQLANIGTDVLRYGIVVSVLGAFLALVASRAVRRTVWMSVVGLGVTAAVSIFVLHTLEMACTSKKAGVCEALWPNAER
ncbi:hypothetical protein [Tahibacter soli]|uniref:Uncharacterized protein n=1 Tax=Tahibacter soli TaxID=2983605 RepID=A0A9X3YI14_9GAMM|nr:hypothetical protein [Tahibacter soli]MDC8012032.1 hypothetical protein [Tahibacter soli]